MASEAVVADGTLRRAKEPAPGGDVPPCQLGNIIVLPSIRLKPILLLIHFRGLGVPMCKLWTVMNWFPIRGGGAIALETPAVEAREGAGDDARTWEGMPEGVVAPGVPATDSSFAVPARREESQSSG